MMLLKNKVDNIEGLVMSHKLIRFLSKAQIEYVQKQKEKFKDIISLNEVPNFYNVLREIAEMNNRDILEYKLKPNEVSLSKDPVLPFPWNPERLERAFKLISPGEWRQDHYNHRALVWDPFVVLVYNGHHSISVGIWRQEGILKDDERVIERYSIFPIFEEMSFNAKLGQYEWVMAGDPFLRIEKKRPGAVLFGIAYEMARRSYLSESIRDLEKLADKYAEQVIKRYKLKNTKNWRYDETGIIDLIRSLLHL